MVSLTVCCSSSGSRDRVATILFPSIVYWPSIDIGRPLILAVHFSFPALVNSRTVLGGVSLPGLLTCQVPTIFSAFVAFFFELQAVSDSITRIIPSDRNGLIGVFLI